METNKGKRFIARLGADTVSQGMRVKELMFEYAHEQLQATPDWKTFFGAADAEYDRATRQATEELKKIEDNGPHEEDKADKAAWDKVLPEEVEARFRDIDFSQYDISIPSRPPTPQSSPLAGVLLLPTSRTTPASPAPSGGGQASTPGDEEDDPLFIVEELFAKEG